MMMMQTVLWWWKMTMIKGKTKTSTLWSKLPQWGTCCRFACCYLGQVTSDHTDMCGWLHRFIAYPSRHCNVLWWWQYFFVPPYSTSSVREFTTYNFWKGSTIMLCKLILVHVGQYSHQNTYYTLLFKLEMLSSSQVTVVIYESPLLIIIIWWKCETDVLWRKRAS